MTTLIAHRGYSAKWPDHSRKAYVEAALAGAEMLEPDLVSTSDGVLVARHENNLADTTDALQRFPERKTTKVVDGQSVTGVFAEDLTLEEFRSLNAKQPRPDRPVASGQVMTFAEVLVLARQLSQTCGRPIGVYPETKHPTYFRDLGLALEPKLLAALDAHERQPGDGPIWVQSFEPSSLEMLQHAAVALRVQLIGGAAEAPFGHTKTFAQMVDSVDSLPVDGLGVHKSWVSRRLIRRLHRANKVLHAYTYRPEDDEARMELERAFALGVDAIFVDDPGQALSVRNERTGR